MPESSKNFRKLSGRVVEATFVNRNIINLKSNSRSFALHPLNFKSCPNPYYSRDIVKFLTLPMELPQAVGKGPHIPSLDHTHAPDPTKG